MIRRRILVSGRVQGVWFRVFTMQKAIDLNLNGRVRNLDDGRVEAIVEGDEDSVKGFISALKIGPPLAEVTGLRVSEEVFTGDFTDFRITD